MNPLIQPVPQAGSPFGAALFQVHRYVSCYPPSPRIFQSYIRFSCFFSPLPGATEAQKLIDAGTRASLAFPNDVTAEIECHARWDGWGPFGLLPRFPNVNVEARCEGGTVKLSNYVLPSQFHELRTEKWVDGNKKKRQVKVEKVFTKEGWKGEDCAPG